MTGSDTRLDTRRTRLGIAAIAGAAALWALAAVVASSLFARGIEPVELAEARSFVALAALALIPAARRRPSGTPARARVVALGVAITLVNASYYVAIDRLPVAVALVLQYTAPVGVVVWSALIGRRAVGMRVVTALAASLAGVALVSEVASAGASQIDPVGIAAGLGSAVAFGTYTVLSEGTAAAYGPTGALARGFVVASLLWVAYQAPHGWPAELLDPSNLVPIGYVGIAGTLAPFLLFIWGVQRVAPARAAIAATLEPVLAGVAGWVWLGQNLTGLQLAGGALVVGAVLSLQVRPNPTPRSSPPTG
ncbi:MAG: DMT family transporter [Actinomycetota bacterium]